MSKVDPSVTAKRLEQIEAVREAIRKLSEDLKRDFAEPGPLGVAIEIDLKKAINSLEFLKNYYKSKTERKIF